MDSNFYFSNKGDRSFTLIELLVVIAIIGLLSSVVLVSMQGVRERASIAKGRQFSQSIQNVIGVYTEGAWSFETIEAGNQVLDGSGNNNHGTVYGATLALGLEKLGNALSFDGSSYVDIGDIDLPDNSTITAWINSASLSGQSSDYYTIIDKHNGSVAANWRFYLRGDGSVAFEIYHLGQNPVARCWGIIKTDKWYQVVGVRDTAKDDIRLYVNGVLCSSVPDTTTQSILNNQNANIGRFSDGWGYFNGLIDEVRIYSRALSIAEIQRQYASGLEKHQNLTVK